MRLCFVCVLLVAASAANSRVQEIADLSLTDIAMASYNRYGPVIYYNPDICFDVGPLVCEFFRAHEYGHHYRGHLKREYFEANQYNRTWLRRGYEKEADCWAAANTHPKISLAAISFFVSLQGPTRPSWYHPTGYQRAQVISACAEL
ncbi:hypothetical protein KT71_002883 [Congregibacter litoralis KT71]|uniref:Uncharacterized protein n=1 Tax=Congregibacter litoralis KT71 TaxID=314285 RepID=V7HSY3_9GAMM|nr:hypothetical protein KT71_002883 [Congregibacter litoralis KT71]